MIRFGEWTVVANRTEIDEKIAQFLWDHDFFKCILYHLGLYDELTGKYTLGLFMVIVMKILI